MKKLPVSLSRNEFFHGISLLLFQQLVLPEVLRYLGTLLPVLPTAAELNFAFFLINYLSALFVFRKFLWAELDVALGSVQRLLSSVALGYVAYYVMSILVSNLVYVLDPDFANLNDSYIGTMSQNQFAMMAVGTVILVPPAEELLFRGVLFNRIYHKKPLLAVFLSVVLFSLVHLIGYIGLYSPLAFFLAFLQYVPAGLALCFAYIRSGTIFAPILIHTFVNAVAMYYHYTMR